MRIVVDASVALKWVLDEADSEAAVALRDNDLMAPVLWLAEAANALWRRVRVNEIAAEEAVAHYSELVRAPVTLVAIEPYLGRALNLATEIGHPVYDCIYLAVALYHHIHVVTADRRFAAIVNGSHFSGNVRLLGS